ncbi:MAG: trypsin-like peptidase domain-containing protein [Planctomycetes bacterium]|nr:trypsin-like peptidase domain-containing protein [Planctomycetota bacterium]
MEIRTHKLFGIGCLLLVIAPTAPAQQPFTSVAEEVNRKVVKLFGAGGFKGLPSYGSGILISPKGHILTCNNHILSSTDLRVHLYDGRFYHAKVLFREPELDVAVCKIDDEVDSLPHFDFAKSAAQPMAEVGDWLLAFSNCFHIATRDEPMTVQRGVVAAMAELRGRRGVFDAAFSGEVYFIDGIVCNPGAAGGPVTNRKGELLGVLGRELKSTQTDTWINYAIPIQAKADIQREEGKTVKIDMAAFVKESIEGKYRQSDPNKAKKDKGGYHGIILVANAVGATPPYVEEIMPGSPAAQAGLRPDDLVVYLDGELVPSIRLFRDVMRQVGPGQEVTLEIQRVNRLLTVKLKLGDQPKEKASK